MFDKVYILFHFNIILNTMGYPLLKKKIKSYKYSATISAHERTMQDNKQCLVTKVKYQQKFRLQNIKEINRKTQPSRYHTLILLQCYNSNNTNYMFQSLMLHLQGETTNEYKIHCQALHHLLHFQLQNIFIIKKY